MTMMIGKRALVTGASRGIGAAIARALAAEGADVAITYEKSAAAAATVVEDIKSRGRRAMAIQADSANVAAVQASVARTVAELGGLDILVNNAGIFKMLLVKDAALADIDALFHVNVRAPIIASQAAIPHLGPGGRIITIGSYIADFLPVPFTSFGLYAATKSALIGFNKGLARELGPLGATANLIQPGQIDTDMNPVENPFKDTLHSMIPVGRYGTAQEIADTAIFLASKQAQYITGAVLTVDGGFNI